MFTSNPERLPAQTPTGAYACWRSRSQAYRGSSWLASRLPLLRRISQIFFLLVFLALLVFTSLRPAGESGEIHLRAPVRLFFELDPLVAITNALATMLFIAGCCGAW